MSPATPAVQTGLPFWDREVRVQVGPYGGVGLDIRDLRIDFDVEKTDTAPFAQGKVTIYGLGEEDVAFIQKFAVLPLQPTGGPFLVPGQVILWAGYKSQGGAVQLFTGHIQPFTGVSVERPNDGGCIVEITALDSGGAYQQAAVSLAIGGPTTSAAILGALAASLGLPLGPTSAALSTVPFPRGFAHTGPTRTAMDRVCRALGATWAIRDGLIIVTAQGQGTQELAPLVSPDHGLVGSVKRLEGGRRVGFTSLFNPALTVRRQAKVHDAFVDGAFILQKVRHHGSNYAPDFLTDCEGFSSQWGAFYGLGAH